MLSIAARNTAENFIFPPICCQITATMCCEIYLRCAFLSRSVAGTAARIGKRFAGFGNELPVIAAGLERQFKHAESVRIADLAVRMGLAERPVVFSSGTGHELADASLAVRLAIG